jgi:protein-serine/threonine kinase
MWRIAKSSDPSYAAFVEAYPTSPCPPPLNEVMPKACRPLLKAMLHPDPKQRATMDVVMADPWMQSLAPAGASVPAKSTPAPKETVASVR